MKNLALIEAYLDGDLSIAEQRELEQNLLRDNLLAAELLLMKEINRSLAETDVLELRGELAAIAAEEMAQTQQRRRIRPALSSWGLRTAAAVAVLIGTSLWYFYGFRQTSDELYASYYEPYPSLYAVRSASQPLEEVEVVRAMEPYTRGDFLQAKANIELLLKRDAGRIDLMLYLGICQMELKENSQAVATFELVIKSGNQVFINHAAWYKALALLADGHVAQAREALRDVVQMDNNFSRDARKILLRLH